MKSLGLSRSILFAMTTLFACSADEDPNHDQRYEDILSQIDFGAQMSVVEPSGSTWSGAEGEASSTESMTTDHVLLLGSNTKMFTAAIVLQLFEEGAFELDDAAVSWVPKLRDDITIRMLLQHTSGIGEYFKHEAMTANGGLGVTRPWTPEELIDLGIAVSNVGPTEQVWYSNTNYIALGLLIEAITGRSFKEELDDRIFAPLEMTSAGLVMNGDPLPANMVFGAGGTLGVVTRQHPSVGWAAGSAYMTSADLARFLSAMASGELYSSAVRAEQLSLRDWVEYDLPEVEGSYGLGVMIFDVNGSRVYGHFGGVDGFTSAAFLDTASATTVAVLSNQDDMMNPIDLALEAMDIDFGM